MAMAEKVNGSYAGVGGDVDSGGGGGGGVTN